jgi:hypothetical protein
VETRRGLTSIDALRAKFRAEAANSQAGE